MTKVIELECSECNTRVYGNPESHGKKCPANFKCSGTLKKVKDVKF